MLNGHHHYKKKNYAIHIKFLKFNGSLCSETQCQRWIWFVLVLQYDETWRNRENKKVAHTLLHAIIRSTTQLFGFPHFPLSATHSAHHMSLTFRITLLKLCLNDLWGQAGYRGHEDQGLKDGQRLCAEGRGGEHWATVSSRRNTPPTFQTSKSRVELDRGHTHTCTRRALIQPRVCFCPGDTALCYHLVSD